MLVLECSIVGVVDLTDCGVSMDYSNFVVGGLESCSDTHSD